MILTIEFSDVETEHIKNCDKECWDCENTQRAMEKLQTAIAITQKCEPKTKEEWLTEQLKEARRS